MRKNSSQMNRQRNRTQAGASLVEFSAAIVLLVPIVMLFVFMIYAEVEYLFVMNALETAAQVAARRCAIAYGQPPGGPLNSPDSQGYYVTGTDPVDNETDPNSRPITATIKGTASGTALDPPTTPDQAFAKVRLGGIVTSNTQFTAVYQAAAPNNSDVGYAQGRVLVTVVYKPSNNSDVLGTLGKIFGLDTSKMSVSYACTLES